MTYTLCIKQRKNFDSEIGRECPSDGVMHGSALSGGSHGGIGECGTESECAFDHIIFVGIASTGIEYAVKRKVQVDSR